MDQDRITLPEVIQAIEEQTDGLIKAANLKPHNGRCSFSGNFTRQPNGSLQQLKTYAFSISGMAFQDVWNVEIERLKNCCIHVVSPEGKQFRFAHITLRISLDTQFIEGGDRVWA